VDLYSTLSWTHL